MTAPTHGRAVDANARRGGGAAPPSTRSQRVGGAVSADLGDSAPFLNRRKPKSPHVLTAGGAKTDNITKRHQQPPPPASPQPSQPSQPQQPQQSQPPHRPFSPRQQFSCTSADAHDYMQRSNVSHGGGRRGADGAGNGAGATVGGADVAVDGGRDASAAARRRQLRPTKQTPVHLHPPPTGPYNPPETPSAAASREGSPTGPHERPRVPFMQNSMELPTSPRSLFEPPSLFDPAQGSAVAHIQARHTPARPPPPHTPARPAATPSADDEHASGSRGAGGARGGARGGAWGGAWGGGGSHHHHHHHTPSVACERLEAATAAVALRDASEAAVRAAGEQRTSAAAKAAEAIQRAEGALLAGSLDASRADRASTPGSHTPLSRSAPASPVLQPALPRPPPVGSTPVAPASVPATPPPSRPPPPLAPGGVIGPIDLQAMYQAAYAAASPYAARAIAASASASLSATPTASHAAAPHAAAASVPNSPAFLSLIPFSVPADTPGERGAEEAKTSTGAAAAVTGTGTGTGTGLAIDAALAAAAAATASSGGYVAAEGAPPEEEPPPPLLRPVALAPDSAPPQQQPHPQHPQHPHAPKLPPHLHDQHTAPAAVAIERAAWEHERQALLERIAAAEGAAESMRAAAAAWKAEHERVESDREWSRAVADGRGEGGMAAAGELSRTEAALANERDRCARLEAELRGEREAKRLALTELESERSAARAASDESAAKLASAEASAVARESEGMQAALCMQTELARARELVADAGRGGDELCEGAAALVAAVLNGASHLRMAWSDIEARDASLRQRSAKVEAEERANAEEKARLANLANERRAVERGRHALQEAQTTLGAEARAIEEAAGEREASALAREARAQEVAARAEERAKRVAEAAEQAAKETEARAKAAVEQAEDRAARAEAKAQAAGAEAAKVHEALAEAQRALRSAEEREASLSRGAAIEAEELQRAIMEEAVGAAAISRELGRLESEQRGELSAAHREHSGELREVRAASEAELREAKAAAETQLREAQAVAEAQLREVRTAADAALAQAQAEALGATREHAQLQVAAQEAQALCEAFDAQLRESSRELSEREVYVCALIAELRADDLKAATASTAMRATRAGLAASASAVIQAARRASPPPLQPPPQQRTLPPPTSAIPAPPPSAIPAPPHSSRPSGIPTPSRIGGSSTPAAGMAVSPGVADRHGSLGGGGLGGGTLAGTHLGAAARARRERERDEQQQTQQTQQTQETQAHQVQASPAYHGWGAVDEDSEQPTSPSTKLAAPAAAWEVPRLQQELKAALEAAAAAQRSAAAAEEMAAQQQATHTLTLRRERERLRAEHQAEVGKVWAQIADLQQVEEST